jgi:transposase-like protein
VIADAIKRVVEDHTSYRRIASRLRVSPITVLRWVNQFGQFAKSPIEIAHQLRPQWSGILGVDGKPLKVGGREMVLLIAVDIGNMDPFFFDLVDAEDDANARRFFLIIKEVFNYPVEAIVSDFGKGRVFIHLIEELFPYALHQACIVHFSRYVDIKLPKSKKSKYHRQNEFLRQYINALLFAQSFNDAEEMLIRLRNIEHLLEAKYHKEIIRSLRRNFKLLTAHFFHEDLPRDTNIVENMISQLDRKLVQTRGFRNPQNAYNLLKLWFCSYRFRAFSSSRYSHRNGQCPLALAGVNTAEFDWLRFSQRPKSNS